MSQRHTVAEENRSYLSVGVPVSPPGFQSLPSAIGDSRVTALHVMQQFVACMPVLASMALWLRDARRGGVKLHHGSGLLS